MQTDAIARRFRAVPRDRYEAMLSVVRALVARDPIYLPDDSDHFACWHCYYRQQSEEPSHHPSCAWERARAMLAEIEEGEP